MRYLCDAFGGCDIVPPETPIKARRVVATLASSGYDDYLESWLDTWTRNARCPDVKIVVVLINSTERLERLCARYGAIVLRGTCRTALGPHIKSVLYSLGRWVIAQQYLLTDVDLLITGALTPLFDVHETVPTNQIGCVIPSASSDLFADAWTDDRDIQKCSLAPYKNTPKDYETHIVRLLAGHPWRLLNTGVLIASRSALNQLDSDLRALPAKTKQWVMKDHAPGALFNDELLCSILIARRDALWEIPHHFNFVMHCGHVAPREEPVYENAETRYVHDGKNISVMHFMAPFGKTLIAKWRRRLKTPTYQAEIGPSPFPFYYRERFGFFDFHALYRFAVERCPEGRFVEVGGLDAKSLVFLAELIHASGKPLHVDGVDYWFDFEKSQSRYRSLQKDFARYGVTDFVTLRQMASMEAAPLYEDSSLEMVFLDAGHDYEDVKENILLWKDKVKIGGILVGHDFTYGYPGVLQAVQEVLGEPFYAFPRAWIFERTEQGWRPLPIPALQEKDFQEWAFRPLIRSNELQDQSLELFNAVQYGTNGAWELHKADVHNSLFLQELQTRSLCEFLDPHIPCAENIRGMVREKVEALRCEGPWTVRNIADATLLHMEKLTDVPQV